MSNSDNSSDSYVRNQCVNDTSPILSESESDMLLPVYSASSSANSRAYVHRDRLSAEELLIQDYFANNAKFTDDQFIRRFRMSRALLLKIVTDLESKYDFFQNCF